MRDAVRPLTDDDRDAVRTLLRPTEERSTFLIGNAMEAGITDRGGARNGPWFGAFEGERLVGVAAYAKGPESLLVAPGGHARALLAAMAAAGVRPAMVLGTQDRIDEALAALPSTWRVATRKRETLMVLRWDRRVTAPPPGRAAVIELATHAHAPDAARLLDHLSVTSGLPRTGAQNLARAERMAEQGTGVVATLDGRAVSMSSRAASTGRLVHVGATATDPAFQRLGLAGACVDRVLDDARAAGLARDGAVLFTGETNTSAIRLYERLGFRHESWFDIVLVRT